MSKSSEAMKKAVNKYHSEKIETIAVRVPKGEKAIIKAYAENKGKSLNAYVVDLIHADMSSDDITFVRIDDNTSVATVPNTKIEESDIEFIEKLVELKEKE